MPDFRKKFAKIYDKYIEKIYRFIILKVGTPEVAEDLTGQVFLKGWRKFKKGEGIKNISAYLYQIARAEIANYYRGRSKFKIISAEALPMADPQANLEENQQLQSEIVDLQNCLAKLNDEHQDVLILRYLEGYSTKEIARILKKSEGAVRVMIHRALKELREEMEKL
jgi:RNA polymerase sigma-70 factor (ECF subfamily)